MSAPWIAAFVVLAIAVVALAFVQIGILRRVIVTLERAEDHLRRGVVLLGGLSPGDPVPGFEASLDDGSPFTAENLGDDPAVMLFLSATCAPCRSIARELAESPPDALTEDLLIVLSDMEEKVILGLPEFVRTLYQDQGTVSRAFEIAGTPHAFGIVHQVVVASGTPNSLAQLRELTTTGKEVDRADQLIVDR